MLRGLAGAQLGDARDPAACRHGTLHQKLCPPQASVGPRCSGAGGLGELEVLLSVLEGGADVFIAGSLPLLRGDKTQPDHGALGLLAACARERGEGGGVCGAGGRRPIRKARPPVPSREGKILEGVFRKSREAALNSPK